MWTEIEVTRRVTSITAEEMIEEISEQLEE